MGGVEVVVSNKERATALRRDKNVSLFFLNLGDFLTEVEGEGEARVEEEGGEEEEGEGQGGEITERLGEREVGGGK